MLSPQAVVLARLLLQQWWLWAVHRQCFGQAPEANLGEKSSKHNAELLPTAKRACAVQAAIARS